MIEVPKKLVPDFYSRSLEGKACRRLLKEDAGSLPELVVKMEFYCRAHGGVGLAAPQVGIYVQLALIVDPIRVVMVNPEITNMGGRDLLEPETCLSLPPSAEATARVWRSEIVHVRMGTMENPESEKTLVFKGSAARVAQHEIDHLNGVFFINRCGPVGFNQVIQKFAKAMNRNADEF